MRRWSSGGGGRALSRHWLDQLETVVVSRFWFDSPWWRGGLDLLCLSSASSFVIPWFFFYGSFSAFVISGGVGEGMIHDDDDGKMEKQP